MPRYCCAVSAYNFDNINFNICLLRCKSQGAERDDTGGARGKGRISWNYLGAIEREVKTPKLETLVRIINALEVSADDVMLDVILVGRKAQCTKLEE